MKQANFPSKFRRIFEPFRYKVFYGGRGGAKSQSIARALLISAARKPLRILCAREVQSSIKESVHQLLRDLIVELGLEAFYQVLETEIRGVNGSIFTFAGLATHTVLSIKSFEGADVCWVEEGQGVSKKSWDVLLPTIRKPGSEIWVTFNPDLETDDTYQRFVVNAPDDSLVVKINYNDNPYFPDVLDKERLHCQKVDPEGYKNIWLGECKQSADGAIYASEITLAKMNGQICNVPYDPMAKVHTIWDLGWNDSMVILLVQRVRSEIRVIECIEDSHKTLDYYAALLNQKMYNWGFDWIPHDGRTRDFKTGKSTEELLKTFGRKPKITPSLSIEEGIKAARMMFGQCYFDKQKTTRLIESLSRYRRAINGRTGEAGAPLHDQHSHCADAFRYLAINAESLVNEEYRPVQVAQNWQPYDSGVGY